MRDGRGQSIGRPKASDATKVALAQRMHSPAEPASKIAVTLAIIRATVCRVPAEQTE
jgi:hypothetical protein